MKKRKYFNCQERVHTIFNCLEKSKVSVITNPSNIDNIENTNQEKK